jgi:GNAT superfamily N-acetyltransferase
MTCTVQRLTDTERPALLAHFLSLSPTDRCLRFGTALASAAIAAYVQRIDFGRDTVFAVHEGDLSLSGAVHVAFADDRAEIGLSVLAQRRRRGVGTALLQRALEHARNRWVPSLSMQCSSGNAPIVRMARRFHMDLRLAGVETDARLELPEPSAASIVGEWLTNALAAGRGALKAFIAGWNHRTAR